MLFHRGSLQAPCPYQRVFLVWNFRVSPLRSIVQTNLWGLRIAYFFYTIGRRAVELLQRSRIPRSCLSDLSSESIHKITLPIVQGVRDLSRPMGGDLGCGFVAAVSGVGKTSFCSRIFARRPPHCLSFNIWFLYHSQTMNKPL